MLHNIFNAIEKFHFTLLSKFCKCGVCVGLVVTDSTTTLSDGAVIATGSEAALVVACDAAP